MSAPGAELIGFAYGEQLEGPLRRSLGFRLLTPGAAEPWSAEVEALARRLQSAPYPDPWPPMELFCSILLAGGGRLIAVAHYGLADHTVSQRRGGLELFGVVGPAGLGVASALAVYRWLRQRRREIDDLHDLGGSYALADVLSSSSPGTPPAEPVPVLPIHLWQDGVLLFAATAPSDPDHRLGLLEQGGNAAWQWLPLVGPDFPWHEYAPRGPVVAWTPHLAGVALKLEPRPVDERRLAAGRRRFLVGSLLALLLLLLGANLWATLALFQRVDAGAAPGAAAREPEHGSHAKPEPDSHERFVHALDRLLRREEGSQEWDPSQVKERYEQLVAKDPDLQAATPEGKEMVVAVALLSRRSTARVEAAVRQALTNKGYDPRLVNLACERVHEYLASSRLESP